MWALALVRRSRMTHSRKVKNRVCHSRVKAIRVEMMEMKRKKRIRSKQSQTLIGQISASRQKQRK